MIRIIKYSHTVGSENHILIYQDIDSNQHWKKNKALNVFVPCDEWGFTTKSPMNPGGSAKILEDELIQIMIEIQD